MVKMDDVALKNVIMDSKRSSIQNEGDGKESGNVYNDNVIVKNKGAAIKAGHLTTEAKSLTVFLLYICIGILFYVNEEEWTIIDTVYYCLVIITTVGYGDLTPTTKPSRLFTLVFAILGMGVIAIAISNIFEWFVAKREERIQAESKDLLRTTANAVNQVAASKTVGDKSRKRSTVDSLSDSVEKKAPILIASIPIFTSIIFGICIGWIEGWPFLDCVYFAVITVTTIGFGDLSPQTQTGRAIAVFYLPLAVLSVGNSIANISEIFAKRNVVKKVISMKDLIEMDRDGGGQVSKLEYLSYILVRIGKADQNDIDEILDQFDAIDVDKSGYLDPKDLKTLDEHLRE